MYKQALYGWTDYPITELGDEPYVEAPVRSCKVLSYDYDKYARVLVKGIETEIKTGYIYKKKGRFGEVPHFPRRDWHSLPETRYEDD